MYYSADGWNWVGSAGGAKIFTIQALNYELNSTDGMDLLNF